MSEQTVQIELVYEHKDWLLCVKPIGMNFHTEEDELGFVEHARKQFSIELWPVHRLDKATSGLILLAKNKASCSDLSAMFFDHQVEKYYLAVCENTIKKKQGKVSGDMVKSRRGSFKLLKTQENPAVTQFISKSLIPGFRLCLLKPKTGKTHQLRVMMKSLGAAIVGDERYSGMDSDRLYLHAYAMKFLYKSMVYEFKTLPLEGQNFLSDAFLHAVTEWDEPWGLNWP